MVFTTLKTALFLMILGVISQSNSAIASTLIESVNTNCVVETTRNSNNSIRFPSSSALNLVDDTCQQVQVTISNELVDTLEVFNPAWNQNLNCLTGEDAGIFKLCPLGTSWFYSDINDSQQNSFRGRPL